MYDRQVGRNNIGDVVEVGNGLRRFMISDMHDVFEALVGGQWL